MNTQKKFAGGSWSSTQVFACADDHYNYPPNGRDCDVSFRTLRRENQEASQPLILNGGSWGSFPPRARNGLVGFRVAYYKTQKIPQKTLQQTIQQTPQQTLQQTIQKTPQETIQQTPQKTPQKILQQTLQKNIHFQ